MSYFFEMNLWRIKKGTEERLESGQEMLKQIFSKAKISPVGGPSERKKTIPEEMGIH